MAIIGLFPMNDDQWSQSTSKVRLGSFGLGPAKILCAAHVATRAHSVTRLPKWSPRLMDIIKCTVGREFNTDFRHHEC